MSIKNKKKKAENGVTAEHVVELVKALCKFDFPDKGDVCSKAIDDIIDRMGLLTNCTSAGSKPYTDSIVAELQKFRNGCLLYARDEATKHITKITTMIRTLRANAALRTSLKKGSALDTGSGFKGDYHCEACLAAFCSYKVEGFDRFMSGLFQCPAQIFLMGFIII
jgi:hypothetical protein